MLKANEKTAIFIDGANLYATARGLGFDIDYKKLLALFSDGTNLVRAYYYTVLVEDQDYTPIRPLIDWLDYNGFTLITKASKEFTDAGGRRRSRNSIDVDLAVDMLEIADKVDHIVLLSGNGAFVRLIEAAQRRGARVTAISTMANNTVPIADELRRQIDSFVDLNSLRENIARARDNSAPGLNDNDDDYDDDEYYDDDDFVEN